VILLVLLTLAMLAIPGLFVSDQVSNDQFATSRLKTLTSAEADFRANDRDWNHVNDYWTGDVKSLYTLTSAAVPGARGLPDDPPIKLIELRLAAADADGASLPAAGENTDLPSVAEPSARNGYWYAALDRDLGASKPADAVYRQDTGGSPLMGSCHNLSKFGFVAFPDSQSAGPYVFLVNEKNTIFQRSTMGAVKTSQSNPPGLQGFDAAYRDWPTEQTLKSYWSLLD
jgi:hypothetical protein